MEWINLAKKEIYIETTVKQAWTALTVPELRNKWETRKCEIELKVGGRVFFDYGWNVTYEGTITELVEEEKMELEAEDGGKTTWRVRAEGNGTVVSIEYTGNWYGDIGISQMENMLFGTYQFMLNLKSVMEQNCDQRSTFWNSWLGLNNRTEQDRVKVVHVFDNTPVSGTVQPGDYICTVNGVSINHYDGCEIAITQQPTGTEIELEIERNGERFTVTAATIAYGTLQK